MAISDIFLGQRAADVELPPDIMEAQEARKAALRRITDIASGKTESPALAALRSQTRRAGEELAAQGRGAVATARGPNQLLAARRASQGVARGQQELAARGAEQAGQLTAAEQARAQGLELQTLSDVEQAALRQRQLREMLRQPGLLDVVTTGIGELIGGKLASAKGGLSTARGSEIGGGFGQALGQAFERR